MKIGKTYIEFISEKKSKKKSPAAQIKKLTKKQKTLIDKSKDIKDEVSKLAADKDKNPEDKLTSLLLKNKINQTEIDGQKIAIQKQQIALNSKIKGVKKKKKSMPKNEQLAAYADEISLEEVSSYDFLSLSKAEVMRRICLIFRINLLDNNSDWNHVLPIQIAHLFEADILFKN